MFARLKVQEYILQKKREQDILKKKEMKIVNFISFTRELFQFSRAFVIWLYEYLFLIDMMAYMSQTKPSFHLKRSTSPLKKYLQLSILLFMISFQNFWIFCLHFQTLNLVCITRAALSKRFVAKDKVLANEYQGGMSFCSLP